MSVCGWWQVERVYLGLSTSRSGESGCARQRRDLARVGIIASTMPDPRVEVASRRDETRDRDLQEDVRLQQ